MEEKQLQQFLNALSVALRRNSDELSGALNNVVMKFSEQLVMNTPDYAGPMMEVKDAIKKLPSEINIPEVKIPKVEIPPFPNKISISEAEDIKLILNQIIREVQIKNFSIDIGAIEKALDSLEGTLESEMAKLGSKIPKATKLPELPMENGRIKVSLPKEQYEPKTTLGERIKKITGTFAGGTTVNNDLGIKNKNDQRINPATEESLAGLAGCKVPIIYNKSMPIANTEYSQVIPGRTKKFMITLRAMNSTAKLSYNLGESGTKYVTLLYGIMYNREGLDIPAGLTLYFQSPKANQTAEIEVWL